MQKTILEGKNLDYQIEELIRDTLYNDATMQGYVDDRIYTDHISDIKPDDLEFPCITMHFIGGRWIGEGNETFSFDRMELEISTDKMVAPKKQIDEIYERILTLLVKASTIANDNYIIQLFPDGKPMTLSFYDEKKNRTIYKKTVFFNLVDEDIQ